MRQIMQFGLLRQVFQDQRPLDQYAFLRYRQVQFLARSQWRNAWIVGKDETFSFGKFTLSQHAFRREQAQRLLGF